MNAEWQFDDAPNTTAFTTTFVLDGSPILSVYHDYDGGWQFQGLLNHPSTTDVGRIVSLGCMISRDTSLLELHDLAHGWCATRATINSPWVREKDNPFPTHNENGYYLEDAVWISQYRADVNPSSQDIRDNLSVGSYVKLLFRFQAENADRQNGKTERMWVPITDLDEDGYYIGTLENNPSHNHILESGDTIYFHPLHVMEVLTESGS